MTNKLNTEYKLLEKQVRDYVGASECRCNPAKSEICWKHLFEFNLRHIDAAKPEGDA